MSRKRKCPNWKNKTSRTPPAVLEQMEGRLLLSVPVTDYSNVALSAAPTLPAKYGTYIDPDFGTKIIRLTDSTDGANNHVAYSYWPTFNKDSTYLQINRNGSATLYSFNPTTLAISNLGALYVGNPPGYANKPNWEDSTWSANDPQSIFGHEGPRIWKYNVVTHVYTLVKDFTGSPGWVSGEKVSQMTRSMDDDSFGFHKTDGTGNATGYMVYRASDNNIRLNVNIADVGGVLDEVQIDKSGQYLVAKSPSLAERMRVYDVVNNTQTILYAAQHPPGHSDIGNGLLIGFDGNNNRTNARDLATPNTYYDAWVPPPANQGGALWQDGHLSMLMDGDEWALHSKILYNLPANQGKTGPFLDELFLVSTEGAGRVIRFAHHRSKVTDQGTEYWDCPMANVSRDGRFVAYNSDWTDSGQRDVFIAVLPIPGDANMDYVVNQTDYDVWAANNGTLTGATWGMGDWDADHDVDSADLALWQEHSGGGSLPTVSISATDASASEAGLDTGTYRVTRTGATTAALTVYFSKSGAAVSGTDYNNNPSGTSVTIPIGATYADITLTPIQDTLIEGTQAAVITLSTDAAYTIGSPSSATVNIADNDFPTITIAATDASASETGPDTGLFTITRAGTYEGTAGALTVNYAISGTATNGSDYSTLATSATFASGSMSQTITVTPINDATVESTETVILTISTNANYTVGSPSSATVNIADNDTASVSAYDGFNYTVGNGSNWNGQTGGSGWSDAWSVTSTSKSSVLSGSLTYSSGGNALATTGNRVQLTSGADATRHLSDTYGADGTSRWIGFEYVHNGTGNSNLALQTTQFRVGLCGGGYLNMRARVGTSDLYGSSTIAPVVGTTYFLVVRIDYGTQGSGQDVARLWINPVPGTVPSDASANAIVSLPVGTYYTSGNTLGLMTESNTQQPVFDEVRWGTSYLDVAPVDAAATVTISATDSSASETGPDNGVFTVTRTGSTSAALAVNYSIGGTASSADYTQTLSGVVTIPAGSASTTITVTPVDDTSIEGSETLILTVTAGTGYSVGSPSAGTVTIADNDVPSVTISATDASASETGPDNGVFTVTRNGTGPGLTVGALTVNYSIGGTASSADYTQTLSGTVTIPNGSASTTITITPVDDALVEGNETVVLTVTAGTGYTVGSPSADTVTIADNDSAAIAAEDFNYASALNGGNGGTGWTNAWTAGANTGIYAGSLTYSNLATSGNSAWLWKQATASRTLNYTLGQDNTSLWLGYMIRQHADGGTGLFISKLVLGDTTNGVRLGVPYNNTSYTSDAYIGGTRIYGTLSNHTPVDNQVDFLVWRFDFGISTNNQTPDKLYLWVNPTPGTTPSDASADAVWTLGTGQYFGFSNSNVQLVGDNYYTRTTYDELRFGASYGDVAPVAGGGMAPMGITSEPLKGKAKHQAFLESREGAAAAASMKTAVLGKALAFTSAGGESFAAKPILSVPTFSGDESFDALAASPLADLKP